MEQKQKTKWTVQGVLGLVAFFALLLYLVIPCFLWSPLYYEVIIAPSPADNAHYDDAIAHARNRPEDVFFTNRHGDKLHAWFVRNPQSNKLLLVHHGNAGNISTRWQLSDFLHDCGANVFMYDYRGYGKSSGAKPNVAALIDDGNDATKFLLEQRHFAPSQIIHYGESIGSGVACDVAAKDKYAGLILHSGLSSLPSVGRNVFAFLRVYPDVFFPVPQMRNIDTIRNVHAPVLFFAAIPDTIVSYHEGEAVYANANEPKQIVLLKESSHNCTTGGDCALVESAMRKFLTQ